MAFKKGNKTKSQFKKGHKGYTPWKGKSRSENTKNKIKVANKDKHNSPDTEFKKGKNIIKNEKWINNQANSLKSFYQTEEGKKRKKEISKTIKISRAKQIFPIKDTSIEIKIQNFLSKLHVEFFTHKYMNIEHGYQCDILIPEQINIYPDGSIIEIKQKTIIECDGDAFHFNPKKYNKDSKIFKNGMTAQERWDLDRLRTSELIEKGFKVLRLWECEIRPMTIKQFEERLK